MLVNLENRIIDVIKQFPVPKMADGRFVKQIVDILTANELESMNDEELFKIILSSFNLFFFAPITSIDLQFTEECNLRCDYCFVMDKRENCFSAEMGKRALDFMVMNSGGEQKLNLVFFGGEPLLQFDSLYKVMLYGDEITLKTEKKVGFAATTNGLLFTKEILMKSRGRINYLLSIDGDEETHNKHRKFKNGEGSFKHIFPKIYLLKQYQPWVGARMTVCPDTIQNLMKNVDFLYRNGVNQFLIGPSFELDWTEEALRMYEEQYTMLGDYHLAKSANKEYFRMTFFEKEADPDCMNGKWGCYAGRSHMVIRYNGDIYPCAKFIGLESYDCSEFYLGNIFEGMTNIAARERLFNIKGHHFTDCKDCALINACSGGCPADNYFANKSLYQPNSAACAVNKISNRVLKEYWRKKELLNDKKEQTDNVLYVK